MKEYIKINSSKWLRNETLRYQYTPSERATFIDLLLLANKYNPEGIMPNIKPQYRTEFMAEYLGIDVPLLEATINKSIEYGYLKYNDSGELIIINWVKYGLQEETK
jgi:hypothetical protein